MDTLRVDICYRPLRIAWAIRRDDKEAFRQAVRRSYTLWGGRFNPIVIVDDEEEADRLVNLFRVDVIIPIGESEEVKEFPNRHPHLITPFHGDLHVIDKRYDNAYCQALDIKNTFVHLRDNPEWNALLDKGAHIYNWQDDDPLADVFLVQFGAYPSVDEVGFDYLEAMKDATDTSESTISHADPIPTGGLGICNIPYISRYNIERHYSIRGKVDSPGFFLGDADSLDDLICHWNLRAADISLWFIDNKHSARYRDLIPYWEKLMRELVSHKPEHRRHVTVWSRQNAVQLKKIFGEGPLLLRPINKDLWNSNNMCIPMMHFTSASTLGVVGRELGKPKVSFQLTDKPFCGDDHFHTQLLVASVSFIGSLYEDEQHTLAPPYIPKLNEFYSRSMFFLHNALRSESERIGLIIDAADTDKSLNALPVADLTAQVFNMAGFSAKPSQAGLITRQLIATMGQLQSARVFKIPGVRRLLKTHGPTATFTKYGALSLIADKDKDNPEAKFSDYENLYIEARPSGTKLQQTDVFSYMVGKGLFRIGAKLSCPSCNMDSWTALDILKQRTVCDLCGNKYDATRQLVKNSEWHYRRSGVLGAEKNAQGAIPVALTLQQLDVNLHNTFSKNLYSTSLDLYFKDNPKAPKREVDFVWIIPRTYPSKTAIIIGECKDQGKARGKDKSTIDKKDIDNLCEVADELSKIGFKPFVLLSKLCPFTAEEIKRAKTLNKNQLQAILLTHRELEPYHIYERTKLEFKINEYAGTPEELAEATDRIYFSEQQRNTVEITEPPAREPKPE